MAVAPLPRSPRNFRAVANERGNAVALFCHISQRQHSVGVALPHAVPQERGLSALSLAVAWHFLLRPKTHK